MLSNRLSDVNDKLMRSEVDNKNLSHQMQAMDSELQNTKLVKENLLTKSADSSNLQQQLSSSVLEIEKLTANLRSSENKLKEYQEVEVQNSKLLKVIGFVFLRFHASP